MLLEAGADVVRWGVGENPTLIRQPMVEVLLATFQGERFLREQIESILSQKDGVRDYPSLRILASDDGSTDGTLAILSEYAFAHPERFRVLATTAPTGSPKGNFLRLLQASTAEFVCFADQDDVWIPSKVSLSMQAMLALPQQLPALVFSDLRVVGADLETIVESQWKHNRTGPGRARNLALLLGQNVVTGATAMLNRPLVELAVHMPEEAEMHDHWVALVAAVFGSSAGLRVQTVLYRQHDRNVLGAGERRSVGANSAAAWRARRTSSERQAEALLRVHGAGMPIEKQRLIEAYLRSGRAPSRLTRVLLTLRHGFFVLGIRTNLALLRFLWTGPTAGCAPE